MYSGIAAGEGVIRRKSRCGIATCEMDGTDEADVSGFSA
jgi:hypothetical protein